MTKLIKFKNMTVKTTVKDIIKNTFNLSSEDLNLH